jgi:hypothetical protein
MIGCVRRLWLVLAGLASACGLSEAGDRPSTTSNAGVPHDAGGSVLDQHVPTGSVDSGDGPAGDASLSMDAIQDAPASDHGGTDSDTVSSGYALSFDGQKTYVECGDVPIPGNFTLEAWVYPDAFQGETYVMAEDKAYQPDGQFRFGFIASGQLFFIMSDGTGNMWGLQANTSAPYNLLSPAPIPTSAWSEVAVTKNDVVFFLLVNGQIVQTVTATGSFVFNNGGQQNPFRIASRVAQMGNSSDGVFDGIIDEVRFWNASRSPAQIQADMQHEITATDPNWSDLQDYWPFDEGSGKTTADRSGNYPGTLKNGPQWVVSTAF